MLTDEQIKALRDGCEGVTKGPWLRQKREGHDTARSIVGAADNTVAWSGHGNTKVADMNAAHIARCDPDTIRELCARVLEAEAENKRLLERYEGHVRYGIDLARIIESLCAGGEIVEPKTTARYHYNMAVGARAENNALQARVKVLEDALKAAADSMTCKPNGPDAAHYCPNCDNNMYGPRDAARKALEEK